MGDPAPVAPGAESFSREIREEAASIFRAAIEAVQPTRLTEAVLHFHALQSSIEIEAAGIIPLPRPVTIVGAGKAAAAMALGCEQALGAENVIGEIISTDGTAAALTAIHLHRASHPLPDDRGVAATRSLLRRVEDVTQGPLLCLISGGASSLMVLPRSPLTLADKVETHRLLLECGAPIEAVNTVRKHLSGVKGGGLLRRARVPVVTLLISDVVGDDPAIIGSGPTTPDPTTFADAWRIVVTYGLENTVPPMVRKLLQAGCQGNAPDTVKPDRPEAQRSVQAVIGSNRGALRGAARAAASRGWQVEVLQEPIVGDTTAAARHFANQLKRLSALSQGERLCVLAGGETTVRVRGPGRGGRNQEFALALADEIANSSALVLSAGTDGIDGPTDAAGAFVDGTTAATARRLGLDPRTALATNDSYGFFQSVGGLLRCGPTGTNVMDLKIALVTSPKAP